MSFDYTNTVPATANNPSVDQPVLLVNTQSIEDILAVDHISFRAASGGEHVQVTINARTTPAVPVDPKSVYYSAESVAGTRSLPFHQNATTTFPLGAIRAFAAFQPTASGVIPALINQFNIDAANITHPSPALYTFPVVTNVLDSGSVATIVTYSLNTSIRSYSFSGSILTINSTNIPNLTISFIILQV